jgi:hypothetical protein
MPVLQPGIWFSTTGRQENLAGWDNISQETVLQGQFILNRQFCLIKMQAFSAI